MDYTIQIVIDIVPHIMKHVFAMYDSEDTNFENPEYPITDWNAYEKSNCNPNYRESESLNGYRIVYHDIDKLPYDLSDYQNLTFRIEGKTCALVNFTDEERNKFYKHTGNCILPSSINLCRFVDSRIFEDEINFESKDDFQSILNDWFSYERDRQNESMRKLREISTPTPPQQAEVKGYDLGYTDTQLENLHGKLIKGKFLDGNTKLDHFKNAFNGKILVDFEPLNWSVPTMGAVFFFYFTNEKPEWTKYKHLFEPANYKQLLSQSKGIGTFDYLTTILDKIIL